MFQTFLEDTGFAESMYTFREEISFETVHMVEVSLKSLAWRKATVNSFHIL
jgi:hypothetical protein